MKKILSTKKHISVLAICFSLILIFTYISNPVFAAADSAKNVSKTKPLSDTKNNSSTVDDSCKGVVRVCSIFETYQGSVLSVGSGFGVGKAGEATDIIVTNRHVIVNEDTDQISDEVYIMLDNDAIKLTYNVLGEVQTFEPDPNHMVKCEVLWTSDAFPDIAILKAEEKIPDHVALPLMQTENAKRSDPVYALGFPADADNYNVDVYGNSFLSCGVSDVIATDGTISRFTKFASADNNQVIQHTAAINHGNSGGPLITQDGAVIGINTYAVGESGYSTSLYIDYAMDALDDKGINYAIYDPDKKTIEESNGKLPIIPIAGGAIALVVVIILVAAIAGSKNKNKKSSPAPVSNKPVEQNPKNIVQNSTPPAKNVVEQNPKNVVQNSTPPDNNAVVQKQSHQVQSSIPPAAVGKVNKPVVLRLQGVNGVYAGKRFAIPDRMVLGTSQTGASMIYPQGTPGISRQHCELMNQNGIIYLRDLGSTYGTFLCGNRLPANQSIKLQEGDVFYLSSTKQSFQIVRSHSS